MITNMRTGSIYSFWYSNWKTNIKCYCFIFYGGPNCPYVHAMNIGAIQLNTYDRIKIVTTIKKMARISQATFYDGYVLYAIFKKYLYIQIKKSYRTYNKQYIQRIALINYGLNKESEFSIDEQLKFDKAQFGLAQRDIIVKMMNLYTNSGAKINNVANQFAKTNLADQAVVNNITPTNNVTPVTPGAETEGEGTEENNGQ